ncbi:MAG: TonB-dependent receptor [Bacteroidales bacterium]|nr:TonB-dependent receptor [Bacteroidales bacterium]
MHKLLISAFLAFSALSAAAQDIIVRGSVVDENAQPIIGATVQNLATGNGFTVLDEGGAFEIQAGQGDVIRFSSLGYKDEEITADPGRTKVIVKMKPDNILLDDVVVVGFGTQKKVNLTGSVSSVQFNDNLASRNIVSLSSGLAGLATGLSVIQNSGMAGSEAASLMIRGIGTVNNADPLIVVDDVPDVDINQINPADVKSVSVLKDASACAIYGSRAANGVILVTTKSGGESNASVRAALSKSIDTPINPYSFMGDYARALQLYQQRGDMSKYRDVVPFKDGTVDQWLAMQNVDPRRFPSTDWWNLMMRNGSTTKGSASVSAGGDKFKLYASFNVLDKQGLQIGNTYRRYTARVNVTYDIMRNLSFNFKADGSWGTQKYYSENGFGSEILQYAIAGITPYDSAINRYGGTMAYGEDVSTINPLALYENDSTKKEKKQVNASAYLAWKPVKWLTLRGDFAIKYNNDFVSSAPTPVQAYNFQTESDIDYWYVPSNAGVTNNTAEGVKTQWNLRAMVNKRFGKHGLSATLLYNEERWHNRYQNSYRRDNLHPSLSELDSTLPNYQTTAGFSTDEGLRSVVGRINYNALDRYLLEVNFRADGSSKFSPGHKWGFFPSASFGWRFSEEKFVKKNIGRWFSNGKFRISYGTLGNNSGVDYYEQLSTLASMNYFVSNEVVKGFVDKKMTNLDLSWETSKVFDVGLDLGFFRGALSFEFDYYDRLTEGMIRPSDLSLHLSGVYDAPRTNIGNLRNRGLEGNVNYQGNWGPVKFKLNANISYNRSRLESWNEYLTRGSRYVGMPWGYTYGYVDQGIVQTWGEIMKATPQSARPGDILRVDVNGDGQVNEDDMVAYTQYTCARPPMDYGFGGDFSWSGISLSFLFSGSWGRRDYWLNAYNNTAFPAGGYAVSWLHYNDLWNVNNTDAPMNRMGGNNRYDSLYYLDDMSFLRLKNVSLSYDLPSRWMKKIRIQGIRFFFTAENLLTFTKYRGMDPERIGNKSDVYPQLRSYTFGLTVNL